MLVIRLFRVGKKNQPSFKIVVTDKKSKPRAGRFVEEVGFYNPLTKEKVLKGDRIKYWLSNGAKPSPTINNLLVSEKIVEGKKIPKHKKSKKSPDAKAVETEVKPTEAAVPQEKPTEEVKKEPSVAKAVEGERKKEDASSDVSTEAKKAEAEASAKEEKPVEEKIEEPKAEEKPKKGAPKEDVPAEASAKAEKEPEIKEEKKAKKPPANEEKK